MDRKTHDTGPEKRSAAARPGKRRGGRSRLIAAAVTTLLLSWAVSACSDSTEPVTFTEPRDVDFHPSLEVDLDAMTRTDSGLYLQDLAVGEGEEAAAGDFIVVQYRGWLPDGTLFDERTPETNPQAWGLPLGVGAVIAGWDEGIVGMREEGERLLVIPPQAGYGLTPVGPIPPNSVLVFRVWLLEVFKEGV